MTEEEYGSCSMRGAETACVESNNSPVPLQKCASHAGCKIIYCRFVKERRAQRTPCIMQSRSLLNTKQKPTIGRRILICGVGEIYFLPSEEARSAVSADGWVLVLYTMRAAFNTNEKQQIPAIPSSSERAQLESVWKQILFSLRWIETRAFVPSIPMDVESNLLPGREEFCYNMLLFKNITLQL